MAYINLTGTAEVADSIVDGYDASILVQAGEVQVLTERFVSVKRSIGEASIKMTRYDNLAPTSANLDEYSAPDAVKLVDSSIIITPKEKGNYLTVSRLAQLQTGGKVDTAAAMQIGRNMGQSLDVCGFQALDLSTNVKTIAGEADSEFLGFMYNKLARTSQAALGDAYVMVAHEDVIASLRKDPKWLDAMKYAAPEAILRGEVGMFEGFRVVRSNLVTKDAGVFNSYFLGFNGLGQAVSQEPGVMMSNGQDPFGRTVNIGWYGVLDFKIVEQDAVFVGKSAGRQFV